MELVGRLLVLGQPEHGVLEGQQGPRVDLEGQVQVERTTAAVLGVELDLPDLAERVGLDEMALIVHVEAMVDRVILEVGHVSGHIDDCHRWLSLPVRGLLRYRRPMDDDALLEVLHATASAVAEALGALSDWGLGRHPRLAVPVGSGGRRRRGGGARPGRPGRDVRGVRAPATGPSAGGGDRSGGRIHQCGEGHSLVRHQPVCRGRGGPPGGRGGQSGVGNPIRSRPGRGGQEGRTADPSRPKCEALNEAIVGFSGYPERYLGWSQYRSLGAAALDLCAVAEGVLDGYAAVGGSQLGSWDYLGGMLVCTEAGAVLAESKGRDLVTLDHAARRTPVAASTSALLERLRDAVVSGKSALLPAVAGRISVTRVRDGGSATLSPARWQLIEGV